MLAVLVEEGAPLKVKVIFERVAERLDGHVTYGHVKDFLSVRSRGPDASRLFVKSGHGEYYIAPHVDLDHRWPRVGTAHQKF